MRRYFRQEWDRVAEIIEDRNGVKVANLDLDAGQPAGGRVVIKDRKGRAIRYYRWLRGEPGRTDENMLLNNGFNPAWLNVPKVVGV